MKRFILIAIACMMVFTLAACNFNIGNPPSGGDTTVSGATGDGNTQGGGTQGGGSAGKTDLTTVGGFLSAFGLTEDDIKCANFTRMDRTTYNNETQVIKEVGVYTSRKLTEEEGKEWLTKIMNKLNSISDDGKVINSHADANGAALTVDFIMGQAYKFGGGDFKYNGKTVAVLIAFFPTASDNADPNEAMPACTIQLEYY